MRVARHIEERGLGVLFSGGSQRLIEDGSQAEEFVLPPAEGMIVGELFECMSQEERLVYKG